MLRPESDDHTNGAGLQELIEQFEHFFHSKEQGYFDDEGLDRLYEFYESRMEEDKMEAVADLAISQNPYSGEFLTRKAELLFNRRATEEALSILDKAQIFDSYNIDIYLLRSDILTEQNKGEEAIATLLEALDKADKQEKDIVLAELSDLYELKEDFNAAFDCLHRAATLNPGNDNVLMKLAHVVEMTDRYDESLAIHRKIVDSSPYNWMAWYNLGKAQSGVGNYQMALEAFEFTIAIQEDFDLVCRDAADIYFRLEEYEKAIDSFTEAQSKSGGFEDHNFRIGLCHEKLNDLKKARFHYRKSTRHDPYLDEAFFRIAETYREEGRFEPALVNYKKALRIDPENEFYISCLIGLYRMTGREEEIATYLQQLVNLRPDILNYWLDFIAYRYEQEEWDEADTLIASAREQCGNYVEFTYLLSLVYWRIGKHRESQNLLASALQDDYSRHRILHETDQAFFTDQANAQLLQMYR